MDEPRSFTFIDSTTTSIRLNWIEPDLGGEAFSVQKYIVSETTNTSPIKRNTTDTSIDFDELTSNTKYMFTVAVEASNGRMSDETDAILALTSMQM